MNSFTRDDPEDRSKMRVIDTDYSTYAITWSCTDDNWHGIRTDYITILSRTPTLSEAQMNQIRDKVAV